MTANPRQVARPSGSSPRLCRNTRAPMARVAPPRSAGPRPCHLGEQHLQRGHEQGHGGDRSDDGRARPRRRRRRPARRPTTGRGGRPRRARSRPACQERPGHTGGHSAASSPSGTGRRRVTLRVGDAEVAQHGQLGRRLHALGDDVQGERPPDPHDRRAQRAGLRVPVDAGDEGQSSFMMSMGSRVRWARAEAPTPKPTARRARP